MGSDLVFYSGVEGVDISINQIIDLVAAAQRVNGLEGLREEIGNLKLTASPDVVNEVKSAVLNGKLSLNSGTLRAFVRCSCINPDDWMHPEHWGD